MSMKINIVKNSDNEFELRGVNCFTKTLGTKTLEIIPKWNNAKEVTPSDDQTVFVINNRLHMLPMKAYYDENFDCYICLEVYCNIPIDVTHWIEMLSYPEKQDKEF